MEQGLKEAMPTWVCVLSYCLMPNNVIWSGPKQRVFTRNAVETCHFWQSTAAGQWSLMSNTVLRVFERETCYW